MPFILICPFQYHSLKCNRNMILKRIFHIYIKLSGRQISIISFNLECACVCARIYSFSVRWIQQFWAKLMRLDPGLRYNNRNTFVDYCDGDVKLGWWNLADSIRLMLSVCMNVVLCLLQVSSIHHFIAHFRSIRNCIYSLILAYDQKRKSLYWR